MRHLKTIKEHYDTAELQGEFEIPELKGDLDFKSLVSDDSMMPVGDKYTKVFNNLVSDIPFLAEFEGGSKDGALMLYKKFEKVFSETEKVTATMIIMIDVNYDDSYVLTLQSRVFGYVNEVETILYEDDYSHQLMDGIEKLKRVFKTSILYKIKKWSDSVKHSIGEEFMPEEVEAIRFNPRYN